MHNGGNEESTYEFIIRTHLNVLLLQMKNSAKVSIWQSIPHGQRDLKFDMFFVSRRPLRVKTIPNNDGSIYRPSILMNSTYLWFPFTAGNYEISIRRRKIDVLGTADAKESVNSK